MDIPRSRELLSCVVAGVVVAPSSAGGQVCTFVGADGAAWLNDANWDCGNTPTSQDGVVVIGSRTVVAGGNARCADLALFGGASIEFPLENLGQLTIDDTQSQINWQFAISLNTALEPADYNRDLQIIVLGANVADQLGDVFSVEINENWSVLISAFSNVVRVRAWITADTNRDGFVTPADFTAWINAYNNGSVGVADQNGDGLLTPADFNSWIFNYNRFLNGGG